MILLDQMIFEYKKLLMFVFYLKRFFMKHQTQLI